MFSVSSVCSVGARISSFFYRGNSKHCLSTMIQNRSTSAAPGRKSQIYDYSVHFETAGTGTLPVMLLPGALGSARTDFAVQLDKLDRNKFTIVAWDPPGYGYSRPPDRTFPPDFYHRDARVAGQLMKELGYERYAVIGWSDGGITGMVLAAMFPDCVKKLVAFGSQAYVTELDIKLIEATRDIFKWSDRMRAAMVAVYGERYFQELWSSYCDFYNSILTKREGDICCKDLAKIRCPTLIIHGEKDPLVPREHPVYLLNRIAKSKLCIMPEGKHNLHLKFVDEFNNIVTEFLES